jgi:hypothetical protein
VLTACAKAACDPNKHQLAAKKIAGRMEAERICIRKLPNE